MPARRRALGGMLVRREAWRLSLRGFFVLCGLALAAIGLFIRFIYPFLAVTDRVPSEYVVAEGWLAVPELRVAAEEFAKGGFKKILTSGTLVKDEWNVADRITFADWAGSKLERIGVPTNLVQRVPSYRSEKDRTYNSALAVKEWFATNGIALRGLNVYTEGTHARRTRLLFQKAFGDDVQIGVIAIDDPTFDPRRWWCSSEGVREVIGESIAYVYARFLFRAPR